MVYLDVWMIYFGVFSYDICLDMDRSCDDTNYLVGCVLIEHLSDAFEFVQLLLIPQVSSALKFSPDLPRDDLLSCAGAALSSGIDGFVATNTTISRPPPSSTSTRNFYAEQGGLSGRPLHDKSIQMIGDLYDTIGSKVPIVGCGGIDSGDAAWNAITSGASLVQLYSAMVFQGPSVVRMVTKGLKSKVEKEGFTDLQEAVGYNRA